MNKKIRVMIVDDSALVRRILSDLLSEDPAIEVIATASDPIFAMKKMKEQWPDVIILDIEMPRMDGITFLRKLMAARPTPVVMCSTLAVKGAETTMQALSAGAISFITKPTAGLKSFLEDGSNDVVSAVKAAAQARLRNVSRGAGGLDMPSSGGASRVARPELAARKTTETLSGGSETHSRTPSSMARSGSSALSKTTQQFVAIGTSTGGTQALERILTALPKTSPGIVIVQHMPEKFTEMFAKRLDGICEIEVREAKNDDRILPGLALIAPGGRHTRVRRHGGQYRVEVFDAPPVNRHRPSVDVLFDSVAEEAGRNAAGYILTGMGNDGAKGLKRMADAGAYTVAQDESSCIVFGMPKEAIALGAAAKVMPLDEVAADIIHSVSAAHI